MNIRVIDNVQYGARRRRYSDTGTYVVKKEDGDIIAQGFNHENESGEATCLKEFTERLVKEGVLKIVPCPIPKF